MVERDLGQRIVHDFFDEHTSRSCGSSVAAQRTIPIPVVELECWSTGARRDTRAEALPGWLAVLANVD
jgi:hypothetical protein